MPGGVIQARARGPAGKPGKQPPLGRALDGGAWTDISYCKPTKKPCQLAGLFIANPMLFGVLPVLL